MNGYLYANGRNPPKSVLEDVYICLYDEDRSLIEAHAVDGLEVSSGNVSIAFTSMRVPEYVVFESPDFWGGGFRTHGYNRQDGQYNRYSVTAASERFWQNDVGHLDEEVTNETEYRSCGDQ